MISIIKKEIDSFSFWFKIVLCVSVLVYVSLWSFTMNISSAQVKRGFTPTLPAAPKDSNEYVLLSESLLNGTGFQTEGRLETLRLPGYPMFVAVLKLVTGTYFGVTFIQILLVFASACIIRRIGSVFASSKVGEISATLFLLNPVTMTLSLLILTDILFLFLVTLAFYLSITIPLDHPFKRICIVSLLFIFAIYVRGMGIFALPIFMLPVLTNNISTRLKLKLLGMMLVLVCISVIPWIARNYVETGVAAFNSFEAENLTFAIPKFLSHMNGTSEAVEIDAFIKTTGLPEKVWQEYGGRNIIYSSQISAVGERIILERPFSYLTFHTASSLPFLFPSSILFMRDALDSATGVDRPFKPGAIQALTSGNINQFYTSILSVWWKFAERILWLIAYVIALLWIWKNKRNSLVLVFLFISAYLMILSGPAAGPRLSFQAWPYMFMLISAGGVYAYEQYVTFKQRYSLKKNSL